jgi:phage replication-related protein YjqB (UPF0714/DUF867 family)
VDKYASYDELKRHEREGVDYRKCLTDRSSPVVIVAPHGGTIEPHTAKLALAIAGDTFSVYCFEGLRRGSGRLHITSHNFDEPGGVALVGACQLAVGIHGRDKGGDPSTIMMGGLDTALRDGMACKLKAAEFKVKTAGHRYKAECPRNICNRGKSGRGAQLELPLALRKALVSDDNLLRSFVGAVRSAINERLANDAGRPDAQ